MLQTSKVNNNVTVTYNSQNFKSGINVIMDVLDNNNVAILGSPFALVEIVNTGVYMAQFQPTATGTYKVIISEAGSPIAHAQVEITDYDIDTIGNMVATISPPGASSGGVIV